MSENEAERTGTATTAGQRLRAAREASGLSLAEIAARTRIPQRHLEAIERDDFQALPSTTYSVGFAKGYARAVGADEVSIAASVRQELEQGAADRADYHAFQPADPARVPPRLLAWTAALVALLVLVGYGIWRAEWVGDLGTAGPAPAITAQLPPATPGASVPLPPATPANGPVLLTATDTVWLRVYDGDKKNRLFEKEMKAGESWQVPPTAQDPKITTGRPQALQVTVGGAPIPPLGDPDKTIRDVSLKPDALRARTAAPAPGASPTPAATASPAPPAR